MNRYLGGYKICRNMENLRRQNGGYLFIHSFSSYCRTYTPSHAIFAGHRHRYAYLSTLPPEPQNWRCNRNHRS